MSVITPSKEQSKRSAADIFAAFEYQWNYFVLMLLKENDDAATVSFELLDDVDTQTEEGITLYQIKHSVRKSSKRKTINLSNRDTDLWKTISIWMKNIDERPDILENSTFQLITNKEISENAFVKAVEAYKETLSDDELKSAIDAIKETERVKNGIVTPNTSKKKGLDVSNIITELLDKPYLGEFCKRITISRTADILKEDIKKMMSNRFALNCNRIDWVYNQLMTLLKDDSIVNINNREPVSYNGSIFTERYQEIINIGRRKIYFRTDYSLNEFDGNPCDLLFMKQLFLIGDTKEDELDRIAELATRWLCFKNNLHEHLNNRGMVHEDVDRLTKNVVSSWSNCHRSKHRRITQKSSDDELCSAGCNTVDEMRRERFSLANTELEQFLNEGCLYYYSNSPTDIIHELPLIGWHRDWKDKIKKL